MRAKDYFELIDKKSFEYLEETKEALFDLYKLRTNFAETRKYLHAKLDPENILHPDKYATIRKQLRQIIQHDKTFSYFYSEASYYENASIISTHLSEEEVREIIKACKEDYPKENTDEYIADPVNLEFYSKMQEPNINNSDWLEIFNLGYFLFDEIRTKIHKTASVFEFLKNFGFEKKHLRKHTLLLVVSMLESYQYDLNEEQLNQKKKLVDILHNYFKNNPEIFEKQPTSNVYFTNVKGEKTDFIRVINAMYECGFFLDEHGNKALKQDVFMALGNAFNLDLTNYQNLLSMASKTKNLDKNSQQTAIFDRLKEATINKTYK